MSSKEEVIIFKKIEKSVYSNKCQGIFKLDQQYSAAHIIKNMKIN
jgi:hypothetical protein